MPRPSLAGDGLLAAAADWLWECGAHGCVDFLSREFEAKTGLAPAALLGKRLAELGHAIDSTAAARAAVTARKPFRGLLVKCALAKGGRVWLELAGTPVFARGSFAGYRGIGRTVTAEAEAAFALRHSERRLRELFEIASDWFWETDADNRNTYLSPQVETVLGLPVSSYLGKRLSETDGFMMDPEAARASLATIKARQPYRDFVYARKLPDGRLVWISLSGTPFYDEDGVFQGYRGIARDVTKQIEAEQALRDSEKRFRELYEIASDYYWESDAKFRLTMVSPEEKHNEIYGRPAAELYGRRLSEFMFVSFDPQMGRKILLAQKERRPFRDIVFSVKRPDGTTRWISVSGTPIFNAQGEFTGTRGVGVDVTARIEAEAAMRLAQRQLHDAVAYVSQPFAVFDAGDCAVAFNQAFADLHRTPMTNTPVCDGVAFRALAEWQLRMGFYAAGEGEPPVTLEMLLEEYRDEREHTHHLADDRWMMVTYRPLPGGGRVALWTDITALKHAEAERRKLEMQLQHSQRLEALGTLAGGAAHEINNALVPIIALTKIMAKRVPEDSRDRRNLSTILTGAERSRDLVNQILAFSRKDKEGGGRRSESIDLAALLREALRLMRATVPTTIAFAEQIATVPPITGDPGQLHQVVVNLMANAAQAIGEAHGTITVGLRPEADSTELRLWVADTGIGMDEAVKARIFEPFFTTKDVGKGTGLGLAVVHGIVKDHGGRIEVDSAPGRGSRFDIVLPLKRAAAAA